MADNNIEIPVLIGQALERLDQLSERLDKADKESKSFGDGLAKGLRNAVRQASTFDASIEDVNKAIDVASKNTSSYSEEVRALGKLYEGTTKRLNQFKKEGRDTAAIERQLEVVRKRLAAVNKEAREARDGLKEFNEEGKNIEETSDLAGKLGDIFKGVFAVAAITAFGSQVVDLVSSMKELADQTNEVQRNIAFISGASGAELQGLTTDVLAIAATYGEDVNELVLAANSVSKQLGVSFSEAIQQVQKDLNNGINVNGEYLDSLKEYPAQIAAVGGDLQDLSEILQISNQQGIFSDKAIDTVKEAGLRIGEFTKATEDALTGAFGDAFTRDLKQRIDEGAITTLEAIKEISAEIQTAELNTQQYQTLVADVFGGAGEDAGRGFILALKDIGSEFANLTDGGKQFLGEYEKQFDLAAKNIKRFSQPLKDELVKTLGVDFTNELKSQLDRGVITAGEALERISREVKNTDLGLEEQARLLEQVFGAEFAANLDPRFFEEIENGFNRVASSADEYRRQQEELFESQQNLQTETVKLAGILQDTGNDFDVLSNNIRARLIRAFGETIQNIDDKVEPAFSRLRESLGKIRDNLSGTKEDTDDLAKSEDLLSQAIGFAAGEFAKAIDTVTFFTDKLTGVRTETDLLTPAIDGTKGAVGDFFSAFINPVGFVLEKLDQLKNKVSEIATSIGLDGDRISNSLSSIVSGALNPTGAISNYFSGLISGYTEASDGVKKITDDNFRFYETSASNIDTILNNVSKTTGDTINRTLSKTEQLQKQIEALESEKFSIGLTGLNDAEVDAIEKEIDNLQGKLDKLNGVSVPGTPTDPQEPTDPPTRTNGFSGISTGLGADAKAAEKANKEFEKEQERAAKEAERILEERRKALVRSEQQLQKQLEALRKQAIKDEIDQLPEGEEKFRRIREQNIEEIDIQEQQLKELRALAEIRKEILEGKTSAPENDEALKALVELRAETIQLEQEQIDFLNTLREGAQADYIAQLNRFNDQQTKARLSNAQSQLEAIRDTEIAGIEIQKEFLDDLGNVITDELEILNRRNDQIDKVNTDYINDRIRFYENISTQDQSALGLSDEQVDLQIAQYKSQLEKIAQGQLRADLELEQDRIERRRRSRESAIEAQTIFLDENGNVIDDPAAIELAKAQALARVRSDYQNEVIAFNRSLSAEGRALLGLTKEDAEAQINEAEAAKNLIAQETRRQILELAEQRIEDSRRLAEARINAQTVFLDENGQPTTDPAQAELAKANAIADVQSKFLEDRISFFENLDRQGRIDLGYSDEAVEAAILEYEAQLNEINTETLRATQEFARRQLEIQNQLNVSQIGIAPIEGDDPAKVERERNRRLEAEQIRFLNSQIDYYKNLDEAGKQAEGLSDAEIETNIANFQAQISDVTRAGIAADENLTLQGINNLFALNESRINAQSEYFDEKGRLVRNEVEQERQKNTQLLELQIQFLEAQKLFYESLTDEQRDALGFSEDELETVINNLSAQIGAAQNQLLNLSNDASFDIFKLLGLDGFFTEEEQQKILTAVNDIYGSIQQIVTQNLQRELDENRKLIDGLNDQIEERKSLLEEEQEQNREGFAANIKVQEEQIRKLERQREIALRREERLQRRAARIRKAAAIASILASNAEAIGFALKFAFANPANAVTFGAAGTAQFATSLIQIAAGIASAIAVLNEAPQFKHGTDRVTGGQKGKDSVWARLMPDEAVTNVWASNQARTLIGGLNKKDKPKTIRGIRELMNNMNLTMEDLGLSPPKINTDIVKPINQDYVIRAATNRAIGSGIDKKMQQKQLDATKAVEKKIDALINVNKKKPVALPSSRGVAMVDTETMGVTHKTTKSKIETQEAAILKDVLKEIKKLNK